MLPSRRRATGRPGSGPCTKNDDLGRLGPGMQSALRHDTSLVLAGLYHRPPVRTPAPVSSCFPVTAPLSGGFPAAARGAFFPIDIPLAVSIKFLNLLFIFVHSARHRRSPMASPLIGISGAGIGGLAAAIALRKLGLESVVFEQASKFARRRRHQPHPQRRAGAGRTGRGRRTAQDRRPPHAPHQPHLGHGRGNLAPGNVAGRRNALRRASADHAPGRSAGRAGTGRARRHHPPRQAHGRHRRRRGRHHRALRRRRPGGWTC